MYSSEAFSIMYKEIGMSLAVAVNFGFAGLLAIGVPLLVYGNPSGAPASLVSESTLPASTVLYIFGGLCAGAVILVWFLMRTSGELESLEEMNVSRLPDFAPQTTQFCDTVVIFVEIFFLTNIISSDCFPCSLASLCPV